jgi:DNA-binding response OmpR family regulator
MSHLLGERAPLVMLIEDDLTIGKMFQVGLENSGFRVSVLTDESAFFRAIDLEIPDVVVLDLQLKSVITCAEIIYNLRLDDRAVGIPVFVLSNQLGLDGQMDGVLAAGATACLVKSQTNPNQLAARINAVLGSRAMADATSGRTLQRNDKYSKPAVSAIPEPAIERQALRAPHNGGDAPRVRLPYRTTRISHRN